MNKREIIIVLIALGICLYGVINYFFLSSGSGEGPDAQIKKERAGAKDIATVVSAQLQKIRQTSGSPHLPYYFEMIESGWTKDPFVEINQEPQKEAPSVESLAAEKLPDLHYSGFIRAGSQLMAVINGMEYTVGETIKEIGYKIFSITPKTVRLLTDKNQEIIISIEEN